MSTLIRGIRFEGIMDTITSNCVIFVLLAFALRGVPLIFDGTPKWYMLMVLGATSWLIGVAHRRITHWLIGGE